MTIKNTAPGNVRNEVILVENSVIYSGAMDSVNASSEVKITVNLVLNASFSWLEKPSKSILTSHLASCLILGLLAFTAIVLNLCLLLAIFFSSSLKKIVLNQLISYMSIACFLDCSINAPFSIYYMKTNSWLLGTTLCAFNASCVLATTMLITWILCLMCLERCSSIYKVFPNKSSSLFCKQSVAMATVFITLCSLIFPLAMGFIEVRAFPSLFSCCVAIKKELYYRIIIISSFVLPLIVSMVSLLLAYVKNFRGMKDINCQRIDLSYTELFFEESHLWNEWQTSRFVVVIVVLFLILELPIVITFMKTFSVPLRPVELSDLQHKNSTILVSYPIAQVTPSTEKIYFWCKFVFCLAFPLTTMMFRKDIRRKIHIIMSMCKTNSSIPNSNSVESPVSQEEYPDDFLVPQVWRRRRLRRLSSVTCLKSPIIFGKSRSGSVQFMDLTTGIAKWKAKYDEPNKCSKVEKPFFADVFDDEDELTEFVCFQDLTEEELNSSELAVSPSRSKDVAVQTVQKKLPKTSEETCFNISDVKVEYRCIYDGRKGKIKNGRNRRLSKSFTCNRGTSTYVKCKYYMTFPKMSISPETLRELSETNVTSDLLKALQVQRTRKTIVATCDLIPRGTTELLDSPVEAKDIVSL